jgi:threonine/homoserine/homoserine lactone efflux protein
VIEPVAFLGVSLLVIVTPGQDTALTIRNTVLSGRRGGLATALGVVAGQLCWALATSLGLVAVLLAWQPAFLALKLLGAAYLVFLGAQALLAALRSRQGHGRRARNITADGGTRLAAGAALRQGMLSNLGNPKMAVFFTSLLPQFAPATGASVADLLLPGAVFAALTLGWLSGYAALVASAGDVLRRPRVRRTLDAVTGVALVAFGVRVVADAR